MTIQADWHWTWSCEVEIRGSSAEVAASTSRKQGHHQFRVWYSALVALYAPFLAKAVLDEVRD